MCQRARAYLKNETGQAANSGVARAAKPADEAKPRPVKKNEHMAACDKQSRLGSLRYF
jgi:hypothetical protein